MAVKIMIDAGHGGYDNGASFNGRREKDDNLALALAVGKLLEQRGYDVSYTRTTDVYDSPIEKARMGNESGADYFISFHRNSSPGSNTYKGVQTLVYSDTGIKAEMARRINSNLEELGFRNINVSERPNLVVLKRTRMPAILIETGFINNDEDNSLFDEKFNLIAEGIADAIDETILASSFRSEIGLTNIEESGNSEIDMKIHKEEISDDKNIDEAKEIAETKDSASEKTALEKIASEKTDSEDFDSEKKLVGYEVILGLYTSYMLCMFNRNRLNNQGITCSVCNVEGMYGISGGVFNSMDEAVDKQDKVREKGIDSIIIKSLDI